MSTTHFFDLATPLSTATFSARDAAADRYGSDLVPQCFLSLALGVLKFLGADDAGEVVWTETQTLDQGVGPRSTRAPVIVEPA